MTRRRAAASYILRSLITSGASASQSHHASKFAQQYILQRTNVFET